MADSAEHHADAHSESHTGDINVGLLATLFAAGGLFLVTLMFFMVGFFNYMACQSFTEKVINRPSPLTQTLHAQVASLNQGAKIPVDQAMQDMVKRYQQQQPAKTPKH